MVKLFDNKLHCVYVFWHIFEGIVPDSEFEDKSIFGTFNAATESGMLPVSPLWLKSNACRPFIEPICEGILPDNRLFCNCKTTRFVNEEIEVGI